jgi:hypothetical protein
MIITILLLPLGHISFRWDELWQHASMVEILQRFAKQCGEGVGREGD